MKAGFVYEILKNRYGKNADFVYDNSLLIQYLERKTKSVGASSKSRGSFGNLYAIYVLVEDYMNNGFVTSHTYKDYEGMKFSDAFERQRQLPFGQKLQNHALNHRCNEEFHRFFDGTTEEVPILRDVGKGLYWINEKLLVIKVDGQLINLAQVVIEIIDKYITLKLQSFGSFFESCKIHKENYKNQPTEAISFLQNQLAPTIDARIFEILSYVILKYHYSDFFIFIGENAENIRKENLCLYKTGRTNANDGGIDFVMKPIGRFFQVTEVLDFKKYFLDIDKIERFPITFVVKIMKTPKEVMELISSNAQKEYSTEIIGKYISCIEEIITIPVLLRYIDELVKNKKLPLLFEELVLQCQVEYNLITEED